MNTELSDNQFEAEFRNCNISPALFNHKAHLRLAWIHLHKYGLEIAIENICRQLTAYVAHVGAADKYNTTLTIASIKMVNHFMNRSASDNFQDFVIEFPQLTSNFRGLIGAHYTRDIFTSEEAKKSYLEPDLLPFD